MSTPLSKLCPSCSTANLQRANFSQSPFAPEDKYGSLVLSGTLNHLRSNTACPLCRLILHALSQNEGPVLEEQDDATEWEVTWLQNNDDYEPETDEGEMICGSGLYPRLKADNSYIEHCIQLIDEASTCEVLRGRVIPPSIRAEMIVGWMDRCKELHGEDCKAFYLKIAPHPAATMEFLVLDVEEESLVTMPSAARYVALSYVWGHANHLTTVKAVVSEFRREGAFRRSKPPRTIRDGMDLTRALGLRYLWVDALCIVQDEMETKELLISNMDAVYGHAELTIVAASGTDADAGLPGWKTSPPERALVTESLGSGFTLGVLPFFDAAIMNSPHAKRAWTYQEGCLSPRCVVMLAGKAFFHCRISLWREDVMAEHADAKAIASANTLGRDHAEWALRRYAQAVRAYTMRHLTHRSDILNAFAGIAKVMMASLGETRLFFAIPAVAFDWAVLWTGRLDGRDAAFPSWAWVGWMGNVVMATDTYSSFDQGWLLERTWIEWYIVLDNGEIGLLWDPERDGSVVSPLITSSSDPGVDFSPEGVTETGPDGDSTGGNDPDDGIEEEDDPDTCPTYGPPTPKNPYGRIPHPQLLSILPEGPQSKQRSLFNPSSSPPGTLIFSTVIASFTIDTNSAETATGSSSLFRIYDSSHRVCGFIWDDLGHTVPTSPLLQQREIILLSQASPGTAHRLPTEVIGFADVYRPRMSREEAVEAEQGEVDGEEFLGDWHSWDFFNVMLVVRGDGGEERAVCQRDGVGLLHKRALAHALDPKPCWRDVYLW